MCKVCQVERRWFTGYACVHRIWTNKKICKKKTNTQTKRRLVGSHQGAQQGGNTLLAGIKFVQASGSAAETKCPREEVDGSSIGIGEDVHSISGLGTEEGCECSIINSCLCRSCLVLNCILYCRGLFRIKINFFALCRSSSRIDFLRQGFSCELLEWIGSRILMLWRHHVISFYVGRRLIVLWRVSLTFTDFS